MFEQARRLKAGYEDSLPFVERVSASDIQEWGKKGRLVGVPPRRDAPVIILSTPVKNRCSINVQGWYVGPDVIFNLARRIETLKDCGDGCRYTILQWTADVVAHDVRKRWRKADRTFENLQTSPGLCAMIYRIQKYWTPTMLRLSDSRKEYLQELFKSLKPYKNELKEFYRSEVCSMPQHWGCPRDSSTQTEFASQCYPLWRTKTLGVIRTRS